MSRYTTTDVRSFSIYSLKKWGKLEPECFYGHNSIVWSMCGEETSRIGYTLSTVDGDSYMELNYRTQSYWNEEWRSMNYRIPLEAVPCHFGGKRWFFRCPLVVNGSRCGRRVAVLYQVSGYYGCRHCADLTYDSCNENKRFRGWPWRVLSDDMKAEKLWDQIKRTHYAGKPTRKYRRYMELVGLDINVYEAEKALLNEL